MNESNNNPFENSKADKPANEVSREDCYWSSSQENTLYDCYLILRDAGYSKEELNPLGKMLRKTTIYDQETAELFYNKFLES